MNQNITTVAFQAGGWGGLLLSWGSLDQLYTSAYVSLSKKLRQSHGCYPEVDPDPCSPSSS